jgi:hypothetical protein
MRGRTHVVERPQVRIARAELCRPFKQRDRLLGTTGPHQGEAEGEVPLRKAGVEFDRPLEFRDSLVVMLEKRMGAPKHTAAKAVALVESDSVPACGQRRLQESRPVPGVSVEGPLQVYV